MALSALLLAVGPSRSDEGSGAPAIVYFADGSNMPLASWSFAYSYDTGVYGAGTFGAAPHRESQDLLSGKKVFRVAGAVLQVQYREYEQSQEVEGETKTSKVAVATGLTVTRPTPKGEVRLEPPSKELLLPSAKGTVRALGLDLQGSTLTGTRRSFCLMSYSFDVECHPAAADRVVKVEFPN